MYGIQMLSQLSPSGRMTEASESRQSRPQLPHFHELTESLGIGSPGLLPPTSGATQISKPPKLMSPCTALSTPESTRPSQWSFLGEADTGMAFARILAPVEALPTGPHYYSGMTPRLRRLELDPVPFDPHSQLPYLPRHGTTLPSAAIDLDSNNQEHFTIQSREACLSAPFNRSYREAMAAITSSVRVLGNFAERCSPEGPQDVGSPPWQIYGTATGGRIDSVAMLPSKHTLSMMSSQAKLISKKIDEVNQIRKHVEEEGKANNARNKHDDSDSGGSPDPTGKRSGSSRKKKRRVKKNIPARNAAGMCLKCYRTESSEWRRGPRGMRTYCNACGLQWAKNTHAAAAAALLERDE